MRILKIKNANIYNSETKSFFRGALIAEDGIITKICDSLDDADAIDLEGKYLIPGMVDVHTHGRAGYDFDSASVEQFHEMQRSYAAAGTTTVMATIASGADGADRDLYRKLQGNKRASYGRMCGVHRRNSL